MRVESNGDGQGSMDPLIESRRKRISSIADIRGNQGSTIGGRFSSSEDRLQNVDLECGHSQRFNQPHPRVGDVVLCSSSCETYQVVVAK